MGLSVGGVLTLCCLWGQVRRAVDSDRRRFDMGQKASKFMQPMVVSEELAEVVGKGPMPRTEVTRKLWDYIKKNHRQDAKDKRNIIPDEKLAKVFGSKRAISMFDMTRKVSKHLSYQQ